MFPFLSSLGRPVVPADEAFANTGFPATALPVADEVSASGHIELVPLASDHLNSLAHLQADCWQQPVDAAHLLEDLNDAGRAAGKNVVVALRGGEVVACGAWVTLDLARTGQFFMAPLFGHDAAALQSVVDHILSVAIAEGATSVRVSARQTEPIKTALLTALGFVPRFEWVFFSRANLLGLPQALPAGWVRESYEQVDWLLLAEDFAEMFAHVPNCTLPPADVLRQDWRDRDWEGSWVLRDPNGRYGALALLRDGWVEPVGVRPEWRGLGLAEVLYQRLAQSLDQRGRMPLRAMVASSNLPSMRLHQRLGFIEDAPRSQMMELGLRR
ncbi:GNAT family N-acetyltransferase [Parachitinimonas caeni]|uniref:GNAT family N-acetyltransferase n=1 Tax=Parachitinimonas caeni TaxID=3031301 RepID=A0ABT7E3R6_9NEIS|nr:GNAT family N-acetyltransferase [Parachitinimonas caeni]MDK2126950.1 GNAT family N-acetyltransferase [Parachitinimonas caeni]